MNHRIRAEIVKRTLETPKTSESWLKLGIGAVAILLVAIFLICYLEPAIRAGME